ncbi:MAG TPA: pantoate--beta-alanine ligase [Saprospiraceae bacterium]|nr:pantoate--beta-alanine ligase [Saprospiraceae bacterium]
MFIFKNNKDLLLLLDSVRKNKQTIGFVPTMGALHEGHLSLVASAKKQTDFVVTSIFVNPTQFNDPTDLLKYPRTLENDIRLLAQADNHLLFTPSGDQIYPKGFNKNRVFHLNGLDRLLEGEFRPGHFNGVAMVVHRFLELIQPDKIFMGQKDYQQATIIRQLIQSEKLPTQLVMCPIVRSQKGLALSSRNTRLSPQWKRKALVLHQSLRFAKAAILQKTPIQQIEEEAIEKIKSAGLNPEYFTIINGSTLKKAKDLRENLVAVTAAWAGDVRLIDNMLLLP